MSVFMFTFEINQTGLCGFIAMNYKASLSDAIIIIDNCFI